MKGIERIVAAFVLKFGLAQFSATVMPALKLWRQHGNEETRRYPAAACLGILWALAYPQPGVAGLAWAVPGLFWLLVVSLKDARAFRTGFVVGVVHFLVSLRWLLAIPHPAGAIAGWLALGAYCAIYPATWAWLAGRLSTSAVRSGANRTAELGAHGGWLDLVPIAHLPWLRRAELWLTLAALWVALEMVRARLFTGFPWNFLGVSQWHQIPLLQISSITGVYGLSFLVCWLSLSLAGALVDSVCGWIHAQS